MQKVRISFYILKMEEKFKKTGDNNNLKKTGKVFNDDLQDKKNLSHDGPSLPSEPSEQKPLLESPDEEKNQASESPSSDPLKPEKEEGQVKEPWQYNEDLPGKLTDISSDFSRQSAKNKPNGQSAGLLNVGPQKNPGTHSSFDIHRFDVKNIGHHPASLFILLGVVGFGLAALLFSVLSKSSSKHDASKPVQEAPVVEAISFSESPVVEAQKKVNQEPAAKKEEALTAKSLPSLTLSGIIFDETGSLALINGRIVKEGYLIDGVKLEKVYADKIELNFEGKKFFLKAR